MAKPLIESTDRDNIAALAADWWDRASAHGETAGMLRVGVRLNEHIKRLPTGEDARLALATLTHRDLAAMALAAAFNFRQEADPDVWGDYGEWCR